MSLEGNELKVKTGYTTPSLRREYIHSRKRRKFIYPEQLPEMLDYLGFNPCKKTVLVQDELNPKMLDKIVTIAKEMGIVK